MLLPLILKYLPQSDHRRTFLPTTIQADFVALNTIPHLYAVDYVLSNGGMTLAFQGQDHSIRIT